MNLNLFPNETSIFESKYTSLEITQHLKENTFEGTISSTAHKTNKNFIGEVDKYRFKIISSYPKTAMFCVFEGKIDESTPTRIMLTKKFHSAFKWLFIMWFLGLTTVIFISPNKTMEQKITEAIVFAVVAFFVRYFVVKLFFRKSEEIGTEALEDLLKLKEIL